MVDKDKPNEEEKVLSPPSWFKYLPGGIPQFGEPSQGFGGT